MNDAMKKMTAGFGLTLAVLGTASCAAPTQNDESTAPAAENDNLDLENKVDLGDGWTFQVFDTQAWASGTSTTATVQGGVTITGPAGGSTNSGVCLITVYQMPGTTGYAPKSCSTVNDCSSAPFTLPTGGYRYCANNVCAYRPGPQTSYCTGYTPPGSYTQLHPGTTYTPRVLTSTGSYHPIANGATTQVAFWLSIGCYNGPCGANNTSISSGTTGAQFTN